MAVNFQNIQQIAEASVYPYRYWAVINWLEGIELAQNGGLFGGVREWLILRAGTGDNLGIGALVILLAEQESGKVLKEEDIERDFNSEMIEFLWHILSEFRFVRAHPNGLRKIYYQYQIRLEKMGMVV